MPCATGCTSGRSGRADGLPKNQISVTYGHNRCLGAACGSHFADCL